MPGMTTSTFVRLGPLPDSIEVKGTLAGDIIQHGNTLEPSPQDPEKYLVHSIQWCQETWNMASQWVPDPYLTSEILPEAFWRTVIGNRRPTERPAPQAYAEHLNTLTIYQGILKERFLGRDCGPIAEHLIRDFPDAMLGDIEEQILDSFMLPFGIALQQCSDHRKFAAIGGGYMGLVPAGTKVGNVIAIIQGAQTPFVLRPLGQVVSEELPTRIVYELVGECYVHGMMDGEMMMSQDLTAMLLV